MRDGWGAGPLSLMFPDFGGIPHLILMPLKVN